MATNRLVIVTGYSSISPKPTRKAYLNISEEVARQRFLQHYPTSRDVSVQLMPFEDEFTIRANGDLSAY